MRPSCTPASKLMEGLIMQVSKWLSLGLVGAIAFTAGCRKSTIDQMAFKSAINTYFSAYKECVWQDPQKFPAQADTSSDDQTRGYDALTDAGLLTRTTAEKKRFLIGSKQVTNYDLSQNGRSNWTADQTQPGYGNFCFGHREVASIDSYTPSDTADATQYTVNYHYKVSNLPQWAQSLEMKTAFPRLASDISGAQTGTATLVKSNQGWQVTNNQP